MASIINRHRWPEWVDLFEDALTGDVHIRITHGNQAQMFVLSSYTHNLQDISDFIWGVKRQMMDEQARLDAVTRRLTRK